MTEIASSNVSLGYPGHSPRGGVGRRPRRLPSIAVSFGMLGCLFGAPAMIFAAGVRPLDAVVSATLCFLAIVMASSRPATLPVVVIAYTVFNRLLRRLLDYGAQEFSEVPPTSLVVPALCLLMGIAVLSEWKRLPKTLKKGTALIGGALAYGAMVGVVWGAGMVFELISWLSPLGFGLYVAWLRPTSKQVHKFVAALGVFVTLGLAYGWVQWLLLPPWDEFWVRNCGMGSIGHPQPMRCRFFGPFGAPGQTATIGAAAAALVLMTPVFTAALRIPMACFLAVSSIMPGVRSAFVASVAMLLVWFVLRRGGGVKVMGPLVLATVAGMYILPSLPGGSDAIGRIETLGNISSDGSFRGRLRFSLWAIGQIVQRPYGYGLGSSGLGATRLGGGQLAAFDSGYLQPLYAMGLPGGFLLIAGMYKLLRGPMKKRFWAGAEDQNLGSVVRAVIIGMGFHMIVANALRSDFAFFFWAGVLAAHTMPHRLALSARRPTATPIPTGHADGT